MSVIQGGTFPYSPNPTIPYTDGIVSGVNVETGSVYLPTPGEITQSRVKPEQRGHIVEGYIGNTSCVDANTTSHEVFTGSF